VSPTYALVHEWLTPKATGGSELVVQEILKHIHADLYALIDFESNNPKSYLYNRSIRTTFLQKFPFARNGVQKYLPLLPLAIEQLDLRQYDIILSSSHLVAKGVLASPYQLHICYCYTPMRYAWDLTFDYLEHSSIGQNKISRSSTGVLARYFLHQLRQWDVVSSNRVDHFIAISRHTAHRIWRCYRRTADVIYPPVEVSRFSLQPRKDEFYLTVSRLVSYKKVDLIVKAFNQLGIPLVVIGGGPEQQRLQELAAPNVQIMGWQPNAVVEDYMGRAKAFIFAACEDFGIAPVEAQACGTPVIAYGNGGALETVVDIRRHPAKGTGLFFPTQTTEALIEAVEQFESHYARFSPEAIRMNAERFDSHIFTEQYLSFIEKAHSAFSRH